MSTNWDRHVPASEGIRQIDLAVFNALAAIQRMLAAEGIREPIVIHSGFRTEHTNSSFGGALNSMHQVGQALDFRVQGVSVVALYDRLLPMHRSGGFGLYVPNARRANGWIHIDSSPTVRTWRS